MKKYKILSLILLAASLASCMIEESCEKVTLEYRKTIMYENQTKKELVVELFKSSGDSLSQACEAIQMIQFEFRDTVEVGCGHYDYYRYSPALERLIVKERIYNLTDTTSALFVFDESGLLKNANSDEFNIYLRRYSTGRNYDNNKSWSKLMIDDTLLKVFFEKDSTMLTRFADFYTK